MREELPVDVLTASDKDRLFAVHRFKSGIKRRIGLDAVVIVLQSLPRQDNHSAIGKRTAELVDDRLERFATEDERITRRESLESLQVFREMPWEVKVSADDAVFFGNGGNQGYVGHSVRIQMSRNAGITSTWATGAGARRS